ncbi:CatB-related O-acetyltransferase [Photobacterium leiognathi]|uniref:CatB-related O-acetyltransferase n=1 Tax=Photobacterium leiognathi TaxID=553611 RepID=UPI0027366282|nr:CatB-related O-acetyltransferase [Photobacterium leiognathi]
MLKLILNRLNEEIKLLFFKFRWRKNNSHNMTSVSRIFPNDIVSVGNKTYGVLNIYYYGSKSESLNIGNYVSISSGVKFLLGGDHRTDTISTYPFKVKLLGFKSEAISKGKIIVEDDVWIGMDAKVLSGVRIGKGAVIAAGSIVTKDVEPYSVVGGAPAKFIKSRIPKNMVETLYYLDLNILESLLKDNTELLYSPLDDKVLCEILKKNIN